MSDPLQNLSLRKRLYVKGLAQGKTKRQAALDAGYSPSVADRAIQLETKDVKDAFSRLIRKRVPAHHIAQRIAEGLDAVETKFFQKDGKIVDTADVVAWGERRQYAELAAKFGGYIAPEKGGSSVGVGLQIIVEHIGSAQGTASAEAE